MEENKEALRQGIELINSPLIELIQTIHEYIVMNINPDITSDELCEILDAQLVDDFEFIFLFGGNYYRISPCKISLINGVKYSKSSLIRPSIEYEIGRLNNIAINEDYKNWISLQQSFSRMVSMTQPDDCKHKINLGANYLKHDFCKVVNAMEMIDILFETIMFMEYFNVNISNKFVRSNDYIGCYEISIETRMILNTMLAFWTNRVATMLTDYSKKAVLILKPFVDFDVVHFNRNDKLIVSMANLPTVSYLFAGLYYYC